MSKNLIELLPSPSTVSSDASSEPQFPGKHPTSHHSNELPAVVTEPPAYGKRHSWVPRTPEDRGDGGAFPEIPVAQFPLGMGADGNRKTGANKTITLQCDFEGKLQHDAVVRCGHSKDKVVYSHLSDTKAKLIDEEGESFRRPSEEITADKAEETRQALEKITASKIASALPVRDAEKQAPAQYIRYTPSQQGDNGAEQRIIRMVEEQTDPLDPPKFKINQKIPRPPPLPPAPVMHSPTRRTTVKEQADWKIPPCLSNWENPKGYTVPLDKRLAADGRGMQQVHINENFAQLAESLSFADRTAREAVETRAQMERRVAQKKKAEQEEKMRQMAQKARHERSQAKKVGEVEAEGQEAHERKQIRRDRLDEYRREKNLARGNSDKLERLKRGKERDISEKIALGLPDAKTRTGETQFDQRLFDQTRGLDGGGIDDEAYSAYDKPWRAQDDIQQHIYRPRKNLDSDIQTDNLDKVITSDRFIPDKGFSGAEAGAGGSRATGPVQFERDDDIFGLGQLLQSSAEVSMKRGHEGGAASSSKKRRG